MSDQPGTPRNPVKEVRQALGLSQEQMAQLLGCNPKTVSSWERKGTLPSNPDILAKLRKMTKQAEWVSSLVIQIEL